MGAGLKDWIYPVRVDDDNRVRDRVEDRTQPEFALALRELGCLAVGNVADDPDKDRLATDPYDLLAAGAQIIREIGVMLARRAPASGS